MARHRSDRHPERRRPSSTAARCRAAYCREGVQTWLMVGLAVGMLGIIFLTGQPDAPARCSPGDGDQAPQAPSTDRVRDYQDRLRMLDEAGGCATRRRPCRRACAAIHARNLRRQAPPPDRPAGR